MAEFSWRGLEDYYAADQRAERDHAADAIIAGTIAEYKRKSSSSSLAIRACGGSLKELMDLHAELVQVHGLNWDFVRREWAVILNSASMFERVNCDKLVLDARKKASRQTPRADD